MIFNKLGEQLRAAQEAYKKLRTQIVKFLDPVFKLTNYQIRNPVRLLKGLNGIKPNPKKYPDIDPKLDRKAVYSLFSISIRIFSENGSFILLDRNKALALATPEQYNTLIDIDEDNLDITCDVINTVVTEALNQPLPDVVMIDKKTLASQKSKKKFTNKALKEKKKKAAKDKDNGNSR